MKKLSRAQLVSRAKNVKLIAMDVDGVLTAGDIIILESGEEIKLWSSKDRLLMAMLRDKKSSLILAWITGRSSNAVTFAAKDLGVQDVVQGCKDKKKALKLLLDKYRLDFNQAAYIGDDLIDLSVLESVGFSACPSDAVDDIQERVHYVSPTPGGKGSVRDVIKFVLQAQGKWDSLIASLQE